MRTKIEEITIRDHEVRRRDSGDLAAWLNSISSVLCPTSIKGRVRRNGSWEDCILTGRLSGTGPGKICISLCFSDATMLTVSGEKKHFLPEGYAEEEKKKKTRKPKAKKRS